MFGLKKQSSKDETIQIQLSSKHNEKRMILFIVLLAFGLVMIGYGLFSALNKEPGWREIEANTTSEINCSDEFVLLYNIGMSGVSATEEYKKISAIYSDATEKAFQLFTSYNGYDDINNIYYINQHPNEEIQVDDVLYRAFELIQSYQNRNIYLAPISMYYNNIFYVSDDSELVHYDPYVSEDIAVYYQEIVSFAKSEDAVNIQLLGDNKVKLCVSEEYLKYAEENDITSFIDFAWMKNAFIIDYLADMLVKNGHTYGSISSYDGFCRNLDDRETSYSFNIYDRPEQNIYIAASMDYTGANSIVFMRNYLLNEADTKLYYELDNGEVRTSYLDVKDGKCRSSVNNLICYSNKNGCAEILLDMIPIYIAETMQEKALWQLADKEIYSVYCKENVIHYNDSVLKLTGLYADDNIGYTTFLIEE